ncbi:hypothetical protein JCM10213_008599 [Rhodosporidiobolus nylandii]
MASAEEVHRILGIRPTLSDLRYLLKQHTAVPDIQRRCRAVSTMIDEPGYWWTAVNLVQRQELLDELSRGLKAPNYDTLTRTLSGERLAEQVKLGGYVRHQKYRSFPAFQNALRYRMPSLEVDPDWKVLIDLTPPRTPFLLGAMVAQPLPVTRSTPQPTVEPAAA